MAEVVLKDIGSYKNKLISTLLKSEDICKTLLDTDDISNIQPKQLVYSHVFPYLYVDDTQIEVLTYLCVEVDVPRIQTATMKDMKIVIWACCHKDCMKYTSSGYVGSRVDVLADMVERLLRESNDYGIGKPTLESVTHFYPNKEYYGRQIVFSMPDFKIKDR